MTFAQRRNCLTTHFSERIPVVKRRMTVLKPTTEHCQHITSTFQLLTCSGRRWDV